MEPASSKTSHSDPDEFSRRPSPARYFKLNFNIIIPSPMFHMFNVVPFHLASTTKLSRHLYLPPFMAQTPTTE